MSVLMIDPKIYDLVYVKLVDFTYHNEVNINYSSTFRHMTELKIQEFVKTLCVLNEESYCTRYDDKYQKLYSFIKFRFSGGTINTYQLLKYLLCIEYNIEVSTITIKRELTQLEKESLQLLKTAISEIQMNIIGTLPEYEKCKWSEPCIEEVKKEVNSLTTRSQRRQLRLDKATKTHARNTKRGNTARYY